MARIERLGPEDWREFRDLRLRALADAPDAFAVQLADVRDEPEEHWRGRLAGDNPILGVREGDVLAAMGGGWLPPGGRGGDRMMVWGMWTAPEARGRGHGRSLLAWLLTWAAQRDISTVELHVSDGNDGARRLYERVGFVATGEWEPLRAGSATRIELLRIRIPAS